MSGTKPLVRKGQNTILVVITCVLFLIFFAASVFSIYWVVNRNEKKTAEYMEEISVGRGGAVYQHIEGRFQFLRGLAAATPFDAMTDTEQMTELLRAINGGDQILRIGIADANGVADFVGSDGTVIRGTDVSTHDFFPKALGGEAGVSETMYDEQTGQYFSYYAIPILPLDGGAVEYVLCAAHTGETMLNILDEPVAERAGYFVLVNSEGVIVSPVSGAVSMIKTGASIFDIANIEQPEALLHALQTETSGSFEMEAKTLHRTGLVEPLHINGWSIVCVVPRQFIEQDYSISTVVSILFVLTVIVLALLCGQLWLLFRNNHELERLAYVDPLTGGRNYAKFLVDAKKLLKAPSENKYLVWSMDLKKFRMINSVFGNAVGDRVIQRVYTVLEEEGGDDSFCCRVTADRFVGIHAYREKQEIEDWYYRVESRLANRKVLSANKVEGSAAIGFYCPDDFAAQPATVSEMVNNAFMAKREAKMLAGNQYRFFTEEMGRRAKRENTLEASGKQALERGEITFFVQPKVGIQNGFSITGGEALIRWKHPVMGWLSPAEFLPLFENSGFIVEADRYIFEQACAWYAKARKEGVPSFQLAVNVSRQGLTRNDFIEHYTLVKEEYGIADGALELEFTETSPVDDYELFRNQTLELKSRGFACSIDDFGAGYSSLNLLADLPIDALKLDAAFFQKEVSTRRDQIIVEDFIATAQKLSMKVVAEGIEKPKQVTFLQNAGCDMIQGYVFCKPLSQESFIDTLTKGRGLVEFQQP